ncbi:MAG: dimethylarginine dimethylaminohydrolase family protein [Planctomycetota bacterium]
MGTGRAPIYLVRGVSDGLASYGCDVARARRQHAAYREALGETVALPEDPLLADCCFVEDTCVIDAGRALITHLGAPARRTECVAVTGFLEERGFEITRMAPPATLDGGDVLRVGEKVYVGLSSRTNISGVRSLEEFLGQTCTPVPVARCLHLKTACTALDGESVVLNPRWVDRTLFAGLTVLEADDPNVLVAGDLRLAASPATAERVPGARLLDISEFQKADGGLTCLSLRL